MKILWITNTLLPDACDYLGFKKPAVGGWMQSSLKRLTNNNNSDEIAVASIYYGNDFISFEKNGVRYYILPLKGKSNRIRLPHLQSYWKQIKSDYNPDVVHIHGSEYTHGYEWCYANGFDNVAVSFQGIISAIGRYYAGGMRQMLKFLTFRDFVKNDSLSNQIKKWNKRGELEKEFLSKVKYFIGRTDWDKAHGWALNPEAKYFYVGETLRDPFYSHKWKYDQCEPHTIFASQGAAPLKGVDMIIRALPLIARDFPDVKLRIAGSDILHTKWYREWSYAKFLKLLSKQLGVSDRVEFVGMLDEEQMCNAYLKANVFVCPSSIENSPNSLGEAQMLEMPHLASFVGGVPEITNMNPDVLYRFEEYEMLAKKICDIFKRGKDFMPQKFDKSRYDGNLNTQMLIATYKDIFSSIKKGTDEV